MSRCFNRRKEICATNWDIQKSINCVEKWIRVVTASQVKCDVCQPFFLSWNIRVSFLEFKPFFILISTVSWERKRIELIQDVNNNNKKLSQTVQCQNNFVIYDFFLLSQYQFVSYKWLQCLWCFPAKITTKNSFPKVQPANAFLMTLKISFKKRSFGGQNFSRNWRNKSQWRSWKTRKKRSQDKQISKVCKVLWMTEVVLVGLQSNELTKRSFQATKS